MTGHPRRDHTSSFITVGISLLTTVSLTASRSIGTRRASIPSTPSTQLMMVYSAHGKIRVVSVIGIYSSGSPTLPTLASIILLCRRTICTWLCPPAITVAANPVSIASSSAAGVVAKIISVFDLGEP